MRLHHGITLSLLLLISTVSELTDASCTKIRIQGFVPAKNEVLDTSGIIPAAFLAQEEINANNDILPDYELDLNFRDTQCDASEGTWQLIQSVLGNGSEPSPTPSPIFFGGGCSVGTEPLAALTGRFYNVTQISYGASSPTLSDRDMFPRFFRTIPSETQANGARFALMKEFNWERVATLHETRNIFSLTVEDFHQRYDDIYNTNPSGNEEEEDENLILRSFTDDPQIPLGQIKEKDIRIIFAYMYENRAVPTLCQAYHLGLTTPNHVWFFPAWFEQEWWRDLKDLKDLDGEGKNCTVEQMDEAVEYVFFLDSYNQPKDSSSVAISNKTFAEYEDDFKVQLMKLVDEDYPFVNNETKMHIYSSFAYDAMYAAALVLDQVDRELKSNGSDLSICNFTYDGTDGLSDKILNTMMSVNFSGISGQVSFDEVGTRVGLNAIYQLIPGPNGLALTLVSVHDPGPFMNNTNVTFLKPLDLRWKGNTTTVPRDRRMPDMIYLNRDLIIACGIFIGIAIIIAIGLLVFSIVTITKPLIANSAPLINITIICGCLLMLATCYLLGIDSATPPSDPYVNSSMTDMELMAIDSNVSLNARNSRYGIICNWRLWLLTLGFTLSFGALFAKTWQVYRVYTNPKLKKEGFKMWNFLIIMAIFLVIDLVYLSFWTGVFPFRRGTMESVDQENDVSLIFERCECNNFGYLIGALYVYKGLQVIFGLFLAYESRNVKYLYINDSRFVSIAMYIVVILVGIGAPLSLVLAEHFFIDPAYGLAVFMIIAACMSCMLIIFVPKFVYMWKGLDTMVSESTREEVTVSDGLQLGRTTVDQTEVQTVETEINNLKTQIAQRDVELREMEEEQQQGKTDLESGGAVSPDDEGVPEKPRTGSDGDSGVLVMEDGDDNGHSNGSEDASPDSTPKIEAPIAVESSPEQPSSHDDTDGENAENTEL